MTDVAGLGEIFLDFRTTARRRKSRLESLVSLPGRIVAPARIFSMTLRWISVCNAQMREETARDPWSVSWSRQTCATPGLKTPGSDHGQFPIFPHVELGENTDKTYAIVRA